MTDSRRSRRYFILPAVLTLAAVAALAVDVPTARFFHSPDWLSYRRCLDAFEPFGHALGVLLIVLALHQLDRARRWAIPRVLGCALAAGGAADLLKLLVMRFRPYHHLPATNNVWETFHHWFPLCSGCGGQQSFPSAHTATAFGLAAVLIWLYPQGRFLFALLAVMVGLQRIVSGVHYPSDVLVGAAVGALIGALFLRVGLLPGWLDRLERWWGRE
ncbi:MAG: phosphatase PAP2 family protein [Pirellulales bacterium]|nr:phosphatase PAP2 family protein [Pirellulales bacterium]